MRKSVVSGDLPYSNRNTSLILLSCSLMLDSINTF